MKDKLKFNNKKHKYTLGGVELNGCTTWISKWFKPFKSKEIAKKLAYFSKLRGENKTAREFEKDWKKARVRGTLTHRIMENYFLDKDTKILKEEIKLDVIDQAHIDANHLLKWFDTFIDEEGECEIITEMKVYSKDLMLAGTIDCVLIYDDGVYLLDWKTNKKIDKEGYNNAKAKEPLKHLNDCSYIKYALQLSTYAYMLEKEYGYKIKGLGLVHSMKTKAKEITVPYLKEEVKEMLKWKD